MEQHPANYGPRYYDGETVVVGDPRKCIWGYSEQMLRFGGKTVTIFSSVWSSGNKCYAYKIKEDNKMWWWDDSCFEESPQEEFEVADSDSLISFLMA